MRIIGIDPGYDRLGIAVLDKPAKGKEALIYSSCFKTSSKDEIHGRMLSIGTEIARVIQEFSPDELAIENLFITKNQKTAMRVAEARGIIMYEASKRDIPIKEYTPMEIKLAVTGDGGSDKLRVTKMIGLLIEMPAKSSNHGADKILDDEYDAIAVALAHSAMRR
jgi:crossover junction endodeoxyribonuclease RuvC